MSIAVQHRHRRAIGWTVAIAILLNGWLPILFQAAFVAAESDARDSIHAHHADHASADHAKHAHHTNDAHASAQPEPAPAPTSKGPECPVLHSAVCLCAVLIKVLPAPIATGVLAAATARRVRVRLPEQRPRRSVGVAPFEARAPPSSDRAHNPN
jgi:hypothetical protein